MLLLALVSSALVSSAHAAPYDFGLGLRAQSNAHDGLPLGLRGFGRVAFAERFAVEVGGYARFPGTQISGVTRTLVAIAYESGSTRFRQPVDRERFAASAYFEASPWKRREGENISVWVYGVGGMELRSIEKDSASINPDYADGVAGADVTVLADTPPSEFVFGPALGAGFDVWFVDRVGVRTLAVERFAFQEEPDYGNTLPDGTPVALERIPTFSLAVSLDVMVTF